MPRQQFNEGVDFDGALVAHVDDLGTTHHVGAGHQTGDGLDDVVYIGEVTAQLAFAKHLDG